MAFIPGEIVKKITLKNDKQAIIRYPKWEDLDELTAYINELSKEDTFITFSGEKITKEKETDYLASMFKKIALKEAVLLVAVIEDKMAGVVDITRNTRGKTRSKHISCLGISVRKCFRGIGLGRALLKSAIREVRKRLSDIKMITLLVYSENKRAINFYKSEGFIEYGRLRQGIYYKGQYIDEIRMVIYL